MRKPDIAIIGMSCRFPGANNIDEFWNVISKGKNLFTGIPEERRAQFDFGSLKNPIGAFLEKPFHFDNTWFKISTDEAISMDPQQRIMLELAVEAKESAFIQEFKDRNIGVFIGANQRAYAENITASLYKRQVTDRLRQLESIRKLSTDIKNELFAELENIELSLPLNPTTITGNITNMIASRISHEFNLTGPSLTTDTACSSSLIAIHQACESLLNKECNMAFAGGVNLNLTPSIFMMMEAAQVISKSGKCVPFSIDSDGILLGEGAGLVLLKRLEDAVKDGDPVLSVIKGSGVNNDGHSLGIMTPSWKGQLSLLQAVYSRSDYDPRKISLIEAHGTSTPIGDSIEITVLQRFFLNQKNQLSIGSVKSNIGHLLGASGIAGLIKAVLAIRYKKLPPSIFGIQVNPKWSLEETGFKIQDTLEDWNNPIRAVGVSAFGFGGTNAHVILEEPEPVVNAPERISFLKTQLSRNKFTYDIFPGLKPKNDTLFSPGWNEVDLETSEPTIDPDIWLLFSHTEQPCITEKLNKPGKECNTILFREVYSRLNENTFTISNSDENHVRWFFDGLDKTKSYGIIFIPETREELSAEGTIIQLLFLKHLFKNTIRCLSEPVIWCVTSNAYKIYPHEINSPSQHALTTTFGSAMNENTGLHGGTLDIESGSIPENIDLINQLIHQNRNHPIVVRNGRFYSASLVPVSNLGENITGLKNEEVFLIIGGSSGVGEELAKFLKNKNNCTIIITGTRPADNLSLQLKALIGNNFEYIQVSAIKKDDLQALFESIFHKYNKLNGIIFSAGLINYGTFNSMSEADFEKTVTVKIKGINLLYEVTRDLKVDFIYLMSSVSGLAPCWATGMSGYAAANAYLDAFAQRYTSPATPWISVAWSIWEETGMSKNIHVSDMNSMIPIQLPLAFELFERSLKCGQSNLVAIHPSDVTKFSLNWSDRKVKLKETVTRPALKNETSQTIIETTDFKSIITKLISKATQIPATEIDEEESFSSLGLDSITALDIVGELENEYKLILNPTLLYEYDSISRLSGYFSNLNGKQQPKSFSLLPTQKTFYFNQVFYPESPCNSLVKVEFDKQLDFSLLQKSWDLLSKKHESLRLTFDMTDQGPEQSVADFVPVPIQYFKLENKEKEDELISDIENKMVHKVYQLNQSPLYDLSYIDIEQTASVIIFNAHHIITDAWSITVVLKELMEIYSSVSSRQPLPENESTPLFSDYVRELNSKIPGENKDGVEYWQNELNGLKPYEFKGNNRLSYQNGLETNVYRSALNVNTTIAIENKAKQEMVSLFHLLISAYYKVLHKITGQNDLVIRVANVNRARSFLNVQNLTGCIADSIPLRVQVNGKDGLVETGRRVKNKLLQSQKFNSISSIEYAVILNSRTQSGPVSITPFGMSYLNLDYFSREDTSEYPLIETRASLPFTDLSLICLKQNGALVISWNYSVACFSAQSMKELNDTYIQILLDKNSEINPAKESSDIETLEMPQTALFPDHNLLHEKVFTACDLYPERIAINDQGNTITYAELKAKSIQLANAIIRSGDAKIDIIGVLEYPGATATTGILAVLASGNTWVPLDPDWPTERIEGIIKHSGIEMLITSSPHIKKLFEKEKIFNQINFVLLPDEKENESLDISNFNLIHFLQESDELLLPVIKSITPDSLAYIMYTSGTTDIPKGVMVHHRAVEIFLNWLSEEFKINSSDKFIQTSSLGFGGSIRQIFSTLLAGGEIHPINRFNFKDPKSLLQFLSEKEITILNTVPSVLNSICEYLDQLSPEGQFPFPEKLRLLLIGGEILPVKLVEGWKKYFGNAQKIVNLYGSTETLINATFYEVKNDFGYPKGIPIGRTRKGVHVLLLDENGQPTKQGEKGELFVGGPGIAKGYFKDEQLTNERFVVPGINGSHGIYYRTGDLAKKDGNGEFYFFGRNDNQIQLYGNRIEPAEIEAVLTSFHLINEAAVLDFQEENHHWLTAFVIFNGTIQKNTEVEIRNFVAQKLPSYMVPQKIQFLNKMPLTQAGKIDRQSLRNIPGKETSKDIGQIIPTNTQLKIKKIWEKVLKTEVADLNHDFFSLGGDSILALEVLHHLRKEFQHIPKPIELFRKKTIPELAESIDQINGNKENQLVENKVKRYENTKEKKRQFPLSSAQKGFFILNKVNPKSSPNLVATIPIKGKFDLNSFEKALNFLVERHPMLRTRFIKNGLNTIQEIIANSTVKIEHSDILQTSDNEKKIKQLFEKYKILRFDLSLPPLYKIASFQVSENSTVILFCIHHIIGDAWSLKILTDELLEIYDQITENKKPSLPSLESSFLNLIEKESEKTILAPNKIEETYNFWKSSFKNLPSYEIQKQWLQAEENEEIVKLVLSNAEKEKVKSFCAINGISLFQLIFAVLARTLQKMLHVNRLLINTSVSGRDLAITDIEKIIGCFARSLPVNIKFTEDDLLANVHELENSFLNSSENQEIMPNELMRIFMESGGESMQSLYRFFISFMDFSSLKSYESPHLEFQWDDADFFFNAGSVESELFIGIRIAETILISFNGRTNTVFKEQVKSGMLNDLNVIINSTSDFETKPSFLSDKNLIDSALIAYLPSIGSMSELLPFEKLSANLAKGFVNKVLPDNEPQLIAIETTSFGRTGVVFIPLFADELLMMPQKKLIEFILKAVNVCQQNGARCISLAGNLPSKTNYGFAVVDALKNTTILKPQTVLTTGHSCTVVAVIKTIQKVLKELDLEIKNLSIAVAGFGSIGQASINLLLAEIGSPAQIIIADLATMLPGLQKPLIDLKKRFKNGVEVIPVDKTIPDDFYAADIIIGASSTGKVIDVTKLRPGTLLVDDSFPHIVDVKKAISRMKKQQDVLIVGAGKLSVGQKERSILQKSVPESWIKKIIEKFSDEGLPGCQAESLLMSFDNSLPPTIGLVTGLNVGQYWRKVNELNLDAVGFHLQGYAVDNILIQKVKNLHKNRYGQIG